MPFPLSCTMTFRRNAFVYHEAKSAKHDRKWKTQVIPVEAEFCEADVN